MFNNDLNREKWSNVDNWHSSYLCGITSDGKLLEKAYDNHLNSVSKTDNGIVFGGIELPCFKEMVNLVEKLHKKYFAICGVIGWDILIDKNNHPRIIEANGKSKTTFFWNLIKQTIGVCLIVCGLLVYGMKGLLLGMVFNSWQHYIVNAFLVSKHIGYNIIKQMHDLMPILILSCISLIVSLLFGKFITISPYSDAIIKAIIFLSVYCISVRLLKIEAYNSFKNMLPSIISKFRGNK